MFYSIGYQNVADRLGTTAIMPRPNLIQAYDSPKKTNLLRQRSAFYGLHGEMKTLSDLVFGGKDPSGNAFTQGGQQVASWSFGYDDFGNLQTSTDPTGFELSYQYDTTTNSHITAITDSFGDASSRDYDPRFGTVMDTVDANGQQEHFHYDNLGRLDQLWAPQDIIGGTPSGTPTVAFNFAVGNASGTAVQTPAWATTMRKDVARTTPSGAPATLETVVFVDGLDRVRQTKKDASTTDIGGAGRVVGGGTIFDSKGRVIEEQFPVAEPLTVADTTFNVFPFGRPSKQYAYDVVDRVRSIETPDDKGTVLGFDGQPVAQTMISYDVASFNGGAQRLRKMTSDPQKKVRLDFVSVRGEVMGVQEQNRIGTAFPNGALSPLITTYTYDPLSQLTTVLDAGKNTTTASYDSVGHMVMLISPDAGQTEWRHYANGLVAAKETANLRSSSKLVTYVYNQNRLTNINYPPVSGTTPNPENVIYTYGGATGPNPNLQVGRIASVMDESGKEVRVYDQLGNVSQTQRTMMTQAPSSIPPPTYTMSYSYDVLGRVLNMTYPDGEVLTYGYDSGGKPNVVQGVRNGTTTQYIGDVQYNALDQRVRMKIGGGGRSYTYYPDTKRLQTLTTTTVGGSSGLIQQLSYTYDLVGNLTTIANALPVPTPVAPNTVVAPGPTSQSFTYDDLYQLASASGTYSGCACGCGNSRVYTLSMQYDGLGNIQRKNQADTIVPSSGTPTPQAATTYNNPYTYSTAPTRRPHAPTSIGNEALTYDNDGNMQGTTGMFGPSRVFAWTEDDRLRTETDSGFTNTYLYDADGTRTTKRRTSIETWYVNSFYVMKGYSTETKHIMLGDERVASEMATVPTYTKASTAGAGTVFYYESNSLESTQFTTGSDGSILQHDEYFPTGETWISESKNNDPRNVQPWMFNAKELDETGLYAFGARYYNPKYSVWSSPDPLLARYVQDGNAASPANLGLYGYAWNNPVGLRDPDGRAVTEAQVAAFRAGKLDVNREMAAGRLTNSDATEIIQLGGVTPVSQIGPHVNTTGFYQLVLKASIAVAAAANTIAGFLDGGGSVSSASGTGPQPGAAPTPTVPTSGSGVPTGTGPDFLVTPKGDVIPVPEGASGPTPVRSGKGFQFTGGSGGPGLDPRVTDVRVMDPTKAKGPSPGYPGGYASYSNGSGQTVDPATGRTPPSKSDPAWHIPLK